MTNATRLFQSGVDEQLIMSRTGHRSVQGVRTYKRVSEDQKLVLSSVLNAATDGNVEKVETNDCQPQKKPKLDVSTACKSSAITIDTTSAPFTSTLNLENIPTFQHSILMDAPPLQLILPSDVVIRLATLCQHYCYCCQHYYFCCKLVTVMLSA